jgi:hypothetical protein
MPERVSGRVISVSEAPAGDALAADVSASDTTLPLNDVTYFDPDGGTLVIDDDVNSEILDYLSVDLDADTIELSAGLANAYEADTSVTLYPEVPLRYASVSPTGAEDDTLTVAVPSQVAVVLVLGSREDNEREQCVIEQDPETGSWTMRDVFVIDLAAALAEALAGS